MKEKLTNNLGLKLISLCLAVIFWLVVVTMEDPEQTKTLEIPVTRINEEMIRENDKTYEVIEGNTVCLLYTSPSQRDKRQYLIPSSALKKKI